MIDPSFFEDFIQETTEHLDEMETALLELESKQNDSDLLNEIFRTVHTIKGSAEYLGVERIARLSHRLENLLELLRQGEMQITPDIFDTLMESKDIMSALINDLETGKEEKTDIEGILGRIEIQADQETQTVFSPNDKPPHSSTEDEEPVKNEAASTELFIDSTDFSEKPLSTAAEPDEPIFSVDKSVLEDNLADDPIQKDIDGESDVELFDIFLKQHRENIDLIQERLETIRSLEEPAGPTSGQMSEQMVLCLKYIDNLKSSANYMGYDNVVRLYEEWSQAIRTRIDQVNSGQEVDPQSFIEADIDAYLKIIQKHLPQLNDAAEEPVEDCRAAHDTPAQSAEDANYDFLTDIVAEINEIDEPQETLKPQTATGPSDDNYPESYEIYADDTDEELFEIFLQQLDENISVIKTLTQSLPQNNNLSKALDECLENVQKLRSSANYMGFEKIVTLHENWHTELSALLSAIDATPADQIRTAIADLNDKYLDLIFRYFPQAKKDLTDDLPAPPVVEKAPTAAIDKEVLPEDGVNGTTSSISLTDEIFEEEMDEELFEIFIQQLQKNLRNIKIASEALSTSDQPNGYLAEISNCLSNLQASANYMGYELLTLFLKTWQKTVTTVQAGYPNDPAFSWPEFVKNDIYQNIQSILLKFPQLKDDFDLPFQTPESLPTDIELTSESEKTDRSHPKPNENELFNRLDDAFAHEPIQIQNDLTEPTEDDQALFENLMSGFDTSPSIDPSLKIYEGLFGDYSDASPDTDTPERSISPPMQRTVNTQPPASVAKKSPAVQPPTEKVKTETVRKAVSTKTARQESKVEQIKDKIIKQSMRVDAKKIDTLLNQVGELVVNRAYFSQLFHEMRELQQYLKDTVKLNQREMKTVRGLTFKLNEATVALGRIANELQEGVMKVRMLPISQLFNRYPRLIRDLARDTGKKVNLKIKGEGTELDKMIIEELSDPLLHIIRNAVDHGIETIEERRQNNKAESGQLCFEAYHESNHVVIEISDDGRGLDLDKIKAKALEKNIVSPEEIALMTDKEITALIMRPGFSTADKVTTTSGRGVGMDVVKKNIENLSGTLEIDSIKGVESRFRIKIPLTLAIIQALLIQVDEDTFTIPLAAVEETIRIFENETTTIEGVEVIQLRDSTLPLVRLREVFNINTKPLDTDKVFVVVVSTGMRKIGLVVDRLIRQEEVVIKPLVDYLQENSGFSGATILGDGSISLILDVYELVNLSIGKQTQKRKALIY